ncbi:bifunctional helix-turn-helix transcriptional regulator/GNAT family N-acetyltransferase [Streptomyces sp. MST-110588]|uniref:bifunctional helix-turn-helix transcriptional regulator/GNAT family N-acetyltransferase n=1 Tax=Streptomyces sp. MST-110588 TaxID=2833628 RepID=UPI001F5DBB3B|nr:bifunctional helix-turn-helix transcriptional regulator/GNAT family N-acetyltransferase [Streptomyces sp. MST-110588]UNO41928.1 bifunctional helix-turn-helix transcriptional regulator/GNAT family N-acetyltransferase [Streptomyces sp. MST-110588]
MAVQEIRRFNRFYTNLIGALDYGRHLYTPYTLTEARLLYELAHSRRVDAADLRVSLSLDAGYLSRLLTKFEERELITRSRSDKDSRRRCVMLTERGRQAADLLEERSRESAGTLLDRVPAPDRPRLVASMETIRKLLGDGAGQAEAKLRLRSPEPGDLGWMVQRNAALYAEEYGFDLSYEALVAEIVAGYVRHYHPQWDRTWIAELDGERVGAVMCVRETADDQEPPHTARLRLLLVEPGARGRGIGGELVAACVDFARTAGYREMVLWTNSVLHAARVLYERAGFELTAEEPHHSFGRKLVGQDWRLVL